MIDENWLALVRDVCQEADLPLLEVPPDVGHDANLLISPWCQDVGCRNRRGFDLRDLRRQGVREGLGLRLTVPPIPD